MSAWDSRNRLTIRPTPIFSLSTVLPWYIRGARILHQVSPHGIHLRSTQILGYRIHEILDTSAIAQHSPRGASPHQHNHLQHPSSKTRSSCPPHTEIHLQVKSVFKFKVDPSCHILSNNLSTLTIQFPHSNCTTTGGFDACDVLGCSVVGLGAREVWAVVDYLECCVGGAFDCVIQCVPTPCVM
jgi:hypothetical protein